MMYRLCRFGDVEAQELAELCLPRIEVVSPISGSIVALRGVLSVMVSHPEGWARSRIAFARCPTTGKIAGWAALLDSGARLGLLNVSVFVKPEMRRNGIGSRLVQLLRSQFPACYMGPGTPEGWAFAKALGVNAQGEFTA